MGKEPTDLKNAVPETTRLEHEIQRERSQLAEKIQALEGKASRAADWRYQFAHRPGAVLSLAFGGGLLLARFLVGGNCRNGKGTS